MRATAARKGRKEKLVDIEPRFLFGGRHGDTGARYPDYFTLTNYEIINEVDCRELATRLGRAHEMGPQEAFRNTPIT